MRRQFKDSFKSSFKYDENRIRVITRVTWKDEMPDEIDWDPPQLDEYEENEDRLESSRLIRFRKSLFGRSYGNRFACRMA